jgi:hypothetical protein
MNIKLVAAILTALCAVGTASAVQADDVFGSSDEMQPVMPQQPVYQPMAPNWTAPAQPMPQVGGYPAQNGTMMQPYPAQPMYPRQPGQMMMPMQPGVPIQPGLPMQMQPNMPMQMQSAMPMQPNMQMPVQPAAKMPATVGGAAAKTTSAAKPPAGAKPNPAAKAPTPNSTVTTTTASPVAQSTAPVPASTSNVPNDMSMKGNLQIDALGFKGTLNFDGNPLNILQQLPGVKPPEQPTPAALTPQQPMMMPQQPMMMQQQPMMMPMGQAPAMVPQQPTQPAAPAIDFSGVEKAARALAPGVIKALPALGLPAGPAFINQSSKVIQSVFGGANGAPQQTAVQNGMPMMPMQPMQQMQQAPIMPMGRGPADVDVLNQLDQLMRQVKFNVEMANEASYLASFGEPSMRATSALEAQKNANEARAIADRATTLAGNYSGEAAQILSNIREAAARAQSLADQARTSSNTSNGLTP